MKNSRAIVAMIGIAFVIAIGALAGQKGNAAGPPSINLGTAANFSVLAGTPKVTNTGPTTIDRSVGIAPAASVTGFPPGIAGGGIHAGDAVAGQAQSDLSAAYLVAASAPVTATHASLGGLSLVGGVYNAGGATMNLTGTLRLDGQNDPNSVWIFQATSDLVTASSSLVSFVNGASPCNVFWQVTSSATLGTGSTFVGTIMALTSITLADSVTVFGRALARNGTVTLINDRFMTLECAAAPLSTIAPTATPTVAPAATPIATAASSVTPTTAPTAAPVAVARTAAPVVAGTQGLPSTSTGDPAGPLTMLGIALTAIGVLLLRGRPVRHL